MKKLLLVDDDNVLLRAYRDRLSAHGFQVNTAATGSAAVAILRSARPDLVVLDLMLPDLSGVEVLKFIRSQPRLETTPVVVLTNAYLNDLGREAARIGIQKAFLKSQCSPSMLMAAIDELLLEAARNAAQGPKPGAAKAPTPAPAQAPPAPAAPPPQAPEVPPAPRPAPRQEPPAAPTVPDGPPPAPGSSLLAHGQAICADLRRLFQAVREPGTDQDRRIRLQDFYRKVHFVSAAAAQAEYVQLAQTAAVFEALLYVLVGSPGRLAPSVLHTLANLVDFTEQLFRHAHRHSPVSAISAQVLVVDDDPSANKLVVSALRQAKLEPRSTEDPLVAWQWVNTEHFDLLLLDVEMPSLDGIEFCKRLRLLPAYKSTPVIFVTVHTDFETRAKSTLSGGNDLIAKPILPLELAAKAVMHLLKRQMTAAPAVGI